MLDDLKYIHHKDKSDALGLAEKESQQLLADLRITPELQISTINAVVFAGMGGSALAAQLVKTWPLVQTPFEIIRDYDIPAFVDAHTLFIVSSYSGNTEEELSAIAQAGERGAQIVVIASGGKLADIARDRGYPLVLIPTAAQPRYATLYSYRAFITILEAAGLVEAGQAEGELKQAAEFLQNSVAAWLPTVPTGDNPAKRLALECAGVSPVIYAGPKLFPAAYKWKISFNENAKNVAWCNQLPEFNHNEFLGWSSHPINKPYRVIFLKSSFEHEQVQKRFTISERLLSGRWPAPIHVEAMGQTLLEQLLWTVAFGDFVTLYLGLLNGLDPSPVELIEKFKQALTGDN